MENVKNTNNNLIWASANLIRATAKRPLLAQWASGQNVKENPCLAKVIYYVANPINVIRSLGELRPKSTNFV